MALNTPDDKTQTDAVAIRQDAASASSPTRPEPGPAERLLMRAKPALHALGFDKPIEELPVWKQWIVRPLPVFAIGAPLYASMHYLWTKLLPKNHGDKVPEEIANLPEDDIKRKKYPFVDDRFEAGEFITQDMLDAFGHLYEGRLKQPDIQKGKPIPPELAGKPKFPELHERFVQGEKVDQATLILAKAMAHDIRHMYISKNREGYCNISPLLRDYIHARLPELTDADRAAFEQSHLTLNMIRLMQPLADKLEALDIGYTVPDFMVGQYKTPEAHQSYIKGEPVAAPLVHALPDSAVGKTIGALNKAGLGLIDQATQSKYDINGPWIAAAFLMASRFSMLRLAKAGRDLYDQTVTAGEEHSAILKTVTKEDGTTEKVTRTPADAAEDWGHLLAGPFAAVFLVIPAYSFVKHYWGQSVESGGNTLAAILGIDESFDFMHDKRWGVDSRYIFPAIQIAGAFTAFNIGADMYLDSKATGWWPTKQQQKSMQQFGEYIQEAETYLAQKKKEGASQQELRDIFSHHYASKILSFVKEDIAVVAPATLMLTGGHYAMSRSQQRVEIKKEIRAREAEGGELGKQLADQLRAQEEHNLKIRGPFDWLTVRYGDLQRGVAKGLQTLVSPVVKLSDGVSQFVVRIGFAYGFYASAKQIGKPAYKTIETEKAMIQHYVENVDLLERDYRALAVESFDKAYSYLVAQIDAVHGDADQLEIDPAKLVLARDRRFDGLKYLHAGDTNLIENALNDRQCNRYDPEATQQLFGRIDREIADHYQAKLEAHIDAHHSAHAEQLKTITAPLFDEYVIGQRFSPEPEGVIRVTRDFMRRFAGSQAVHHHRAQDAFASVQAVIASTEQQRQEITSQSHSA